MLGSWVETCNYLVDSTKTCFCSAYNEGSEIRNRIHGNLGPGYLFQLCILTQYKQSQANMSVLTLRHK